MKVNPEGHDNFAFFYEEFRNHLKEVHGALEKVFPRFELALKPHPSTDRNLLRKLIRPYSNVRIANDSIYGLLSVADIFLSFYTTTILFPIAIGQPSIVINSRIQKEINFWPELRNLYEGSSFFAADTDQLISYLESIKRMDLAEKQRLQKVSHHLRSNFPDQAMENALNRIREVLK